MPQPIWERPTLRGFGGGLNRMQVKERRVEYYREVGASTFVADSTNSARRSGSPPADK